MKYKYVIVNNRLIPEETASLVIQQILGSDFKHRGIMLPGRKDKTSAIEGLLSDAEKDGLFCSFSAVKIEELLEKYDKANSFSDNTVHIIVSNGRKSLLYIGPAYFFD